MALNTQPYKGARDFYPEDLRLRKYIFSVWREVVQKFGYEEYDAPVMEPIEIYKAKTGQEIVSEQTYSFTDRGGREVALRPEMTPTVSRMVAAKRQELAYPLRLFNIGARWRYERPQKGRYREFYQLDVDLFGLESINAEVEMIQIADTILKRFGAKPSDYGIRVNSRKLLNEKIASAGPKAEVNEIISLIDHYDKLSTGEFQAKLAGLVETPETLMSFLEAGEPNGEVSKIIDASQKLGIEVGFAPSLARGFDYYTDVVFEMFDTDPSNNRAMFGGGRYDGLVGLFGVQAIPTIGFAMGDAMIAEFLKGHKLVPKLVSETDLYVALTGEIDVDKLVNELRQNLNVAVDYSGRKLDKQIKAADKKGIKWLLVIGENELESGQFKLKNLASGEEKLTSLEQIGSIIKSDNDGTANQ